jgi:hypothetical protein
MHWSWCGWSSWVLPHSHRRLSCPECEGCRESWPSVYLSQCSELPDLPTWLPSMVLLVSSYPVKPRSQALLRKSVRVQVVTGKTIVPLTSAAAPRSTQARKCVPVSTVGDRSTGLSNSLCLMIRPWSIPWSILSSHLTSMFDLFAHF